MKITLLRLPSTMLFMLLLGTCTLPAQQASSPNPPVNSKLINAIKNAIPPQSQIMALYEGAAIPNSKPTPNQEKIGDWGSTQNVTRPTIQTFLPAKAKANGASVIIFPGGGYIGLSMALEGATIALFFQDHGTAAFIVKYRLPSDATMEDKTIGPLQDAQQAIRLVRTHAKEWQLDPSRIGVIGFSAGGHLASTLGTHFEKSLVNNPENVSLRPDFMILIYPVISMDPKITHLGSRTALLGPNPSDEKVRIFSNELQVTEKTPPTLILQAADDDLVDVDNSIVFFEALRHHEVPVDMTLFKKGEHGFFLLPRDDWQGIIQRWLESNRWVN